VEFWSSAGGGVTLQAQEQLLARYGEANPGVTVNTAVAPQVRNVPEKTVAAVAAGTPPDAAIFDRFLIASFAVKQTFLPLTDRAKRDGVESGAYYPFAWKEAGYRGQLYALPYQTGVRGLFANRTHLREAGLGTGLPRTMTEVDQWAVRLTRQEGEDYTRLGFIPWIGNSHFYTWGWLFGGDFYDEKSGKCTADQPANIRALEWVGEYARRYGDRRLRAFEGTFGQAPGGPFGAGLVSFFHTTQGLIDEIARSSPLLEYETLPVPPAPGQSRTSTWTGGFGYIIPRGAKQPDAAWHLIRYLGSDEGELLWTQVTLTLPVRVNVARAPYWQERGRDPRMKVFLDLLPVARSRPVMPAAQTLWDDLGVAVEQVRTGEQLPRDALQGVTQRVNLELAQYGG
jgi:multiple sugar transport system substrate-binding protein